MTKLVASSAMRAAAAKRLPPTPPAPVIAPAKAKTPLTPEQREQRKQVRAILKQRFPATFRYEVPLAIGIDREIAAACTELTTEQITLFLRVWTHNPSYRVTIAAGGSRFHLDGTIAGEIAAEHRMTARAQLDARLARRAGKAAAA